MPKSLYNALIAFALFIISPSMAAIILYMLAYGLNLPQQWIDNSALSGYIIGMVISLIALLATV